MGWFERLFGSKSTKDTLKERLQLVLAYDRAGIPPGKAEAFQQELLELIRKYFPTGTDSSGAEPKVEFEQRGDTVVVNANIPLH